MRLIDADALFDAMERTEWYDNADRDEIAERLIMVAPSIDIVRCKECKKWHNGWCYKHGRAFEPYDFCSYGCRSEKPNNSKERSE